MKVKEESWKSWLKAQHSENEDHGIWSHHFMRNRQENSGNSVRLYFSGLPNHCSHEIKRCLLLGRKVMTNLDSTLKRRDITLSTKVRLVKATVFSVVMCRCESWTVKKAECHRCVDLSLGFLFCSIDLHLCLCASTILSWWLSLCSIAWR